MMRNEVTVSACQHLFSVALAKQSFPYVLAGVSDSKITDGLCGPKAWHGFIQNGNASIFYQLTTHWQKRGMHG